MNDLSDFSSIFLRQKKIFFIVFLPLFLIGLLVTVSLPPVYRSMATILIERQEVPGDMVKSTVSGVIDTRLETVERRVMTRSNIRALIEEYGLYPEMQRNGEVDEMIPEVRKNTFREMMSIDTVDPRNGKPILAAVSFTISFDTDQPEKAQLVANRLAELYLIEHSKLRTDRAAKVSTFLDKESDRINSQILRIESDLAEFKQQHISELPEYIGMSIRMLENAEGSLAKFSDEINTLEERKRNLMDQMEINSYKKGAYADGFQIILGVDKKLQIQKAKLAEMRSKYSDSHPDVLKLKNEIVLLKKEAAGTETSKGIAEDSSELTLGLFDSVYQSQINEIDKKLSEANSAKQQVLNKIKIYEERLSASPIVERDYQKLIRNRDNAMKTYNELKNRQMEAKMAEQLEIEEKAERLSIIQPAFFLDEAYGPNRVAIAIMALFLAFGMGVGSVVMADFRDGAIHGVRGVRSVLDIPVIAVIPKINDATKHTASSAKNISFVIVLVLVTLLVSMYYGYGLGESDGEAIRQSIGSALTAFYQN